MNFTKKGWCLVIYILLLLLLHHNYCTTTTTTCPKIFFFLLKKRFQVHHHHITILALILLLDTQLQERVVQEKYKSAFWTGFTDPVDGHFIIFIWWKQKRNGNIWDESFEMWRFNAKQETKMNTKWLKISISIEHKFVTLLKEC